MMYRIFDVNFFGKLSIVMSQSPQIIVIINKIQLIEKLNINDKAIKLADSSSLSGNTIASSYLKVVSTNNIPIKLRQTEYRPNDSGEKKRLRKGCKRIEISWARTVPVIRIEAFLINSDCRNFWTNILQVSFKILRAQLTSE